jgi:hypothetical protein
MSFAGHDDEFLTRLCERLSDEAQAQTGHPFPITILGSAKDLQEATFLIPVLSPGFFADNTCRRYLESFLDWEEQTDQHNRILPLYYINVPELEDTTIAPHDRCIQGLTARYYHDWRDLRFEELTSPYSRRSLATMVTQMLDMIGYERPAERSKTVVIATLGEYPAVVAGVVTELQAANTPVDVVQIVYPEYKDEREIGLGYQMLAQYLEPRGIEVKPIALPFADANTEELCMVVLEQMQLQLDMHQRTNNKVHMALAGGRKHTAALLTLLPQFYPCIQKLYHLYDPREHDPNERYAIQALERMDSRQREAALTATPGRFGLVELPKVPTPDDPDEQHERQATLRRWIKRYGNPAAARANRQQEAFYSHLFRKPITDTSSPVVLIATLGDSPMVVTQAYCLLQERNHVSIAAICIVYPEDNPTIRENARRLKRACKRYEVTVVDSPVAGLADIESEESVRQFAEGLGQTIYQVQQDYTQAELAILLAGGRKGMAAMALMAAHANGITRVYHTMVAIARREEMIEQAWTDAQSKSGKQQAELLFLKTPKALLDDFTLIQLPVLRRDR